MFFRSAPRHSTGGTFLKPGGKTSASGTYPRERRSISPLSRTTESSIRCTMSRLCIKNPSAMPCKSASACSLLIAGGLPLRLPEVITSGHCSSCNSKCWSGFAGNITPTSLRPGAISSQSSGTYFLSTRTIGAAGVVSNWRAASGKPSATGNMTASGFAGRCLRARSVATALLLRASQAR